MTSLVTFNIISYCCQGSFISDKIVSHNDSILLATNYALYNKDMKRKCCNESPNIGLAKMAKSSIFWQNFWRNLRFLTNEEWQNRLEPINDNTDTDVDVVLWLDVSLVTDECNACLPSFESAATSLTTLHSNSTQISITDDTCSRMATFIIHLNIEQLLLELYRYKVLYCTIPILQGDESSSVIYGQLHRTSCQSGRCFLQRRMGNMR